MGLILWHSKDGSEPRRWLDEGPLWLSEDGLRTATGGDAARGGEGRALLLALRQRSAAIAAVVVPPNCRPRVLVGGGRIGPGIRLLSHADRLEFSGHRVWIARNQEANELAYEPSIHGDNLFCARTKARVKPGELIVVCPGSDCGLVFKAEAWRLGLACHGCRFDPKAAEWRPHVPDHRSYDALLKLAQLA